jgi:hypothetical protein
MFAEQAIVDTKGTGVLATADAKGNVDAAAYAHRTLRLRYAGNWLGKPLIIPACSVAFRPHLRQV